MVFGADGPQRRGLIADDLPALRKVIEVGVPPAETFRIWTDAIGRWWPLATHSVGQQRR